MSSPHLARVIDEAGARQLPVLIDEWWEAHDVRRWLARALRIDLALLTERPELTVPCLHRRCAWLGGPAEAGFYAERPEVPRDAAALRELVDGWRSGRPWLRALRPPPISLDSGVIEEYRTSLRGELRISDDAETIAVVGEDGAIAWDRWTGRRVVGARARIPAPPEVPQRWRVADSSWGRLVLERDGGRIELAHYDEYGDPVSARQLSDELVIVSGGGEHSLVDVRTGRVAWTANGDAVDLVRSPDGERLFRAGANAVEIAALATGETLASWPVPGVERLVLASDGAVATCSGGVVRVWDPSIAAKAWTRMRAGRGPVQLSPGGARLLTGDLLCDARTGTAIASIPLTTGRWLEGGPPPGYQRLTDAGVVEILPSGLQLWDARDGSRVLHDRARRASIGDAVAFDPGGAWHAIASPGRDPRLRVHALLSGELLFEQKIRRLARRDGVPALGASPDGHQLWWETLDGERWMLSLDEVTRPRRLGDGAPTPHEPEPVTIDVRDGLLVVGDAAIPCDDELAVASPDGRTFASSTSHHVLEDG